MPLDQNYLSICYYDMSHMIYFTSYTCCIFLKGTYMFFTIYIIYKMIIILCCYDDSINLYQGQKDKIICKMID